MLTFPYWVYWHFVIFFFLDILWFFFPTAADLILTGDQFPLLLVTANMSVILLVKSLATPIGTRCTYSSLGVTRPSWIPNSRAVKTYRLVYNEWDILAWTAFPNKGKLAPAVWFPELKLRNTENRAVYSESCSEYVKERALEVEWGQFISKLKLGGSRINGHTGDIRKDCE